MASPDPKVLRVPFTPSRPPSLDNSLIERTFLVPVKGVKASHVCVRVGAIRGTWRHERASFAREEATFNTLHTLNNIKKNKKLWREWWREGCEGAAKEAT